MTLIGSSELCRQNPRYGAIVGIDYEAETVGGDSVRLLVLYNSYSNASVDGRTIHDVIIITHDALVDDVIVSCSGLVNPMEVMRRLYGSGLILTNNCRRELYNLLENAFC